MEDKSIYTAKIKEGIFPKMKTVKQNVDEVEAHLDTALEHFSHGWHALGKDIPITLANEGFFPPEVIAPVGSTAYHFAAMSQSLKRAYDKIRAEQDRQNGEETPNTETLLS